MTNDAVFPESVQTLWFATVVVVSAVFVPLTVYLLQSLWRATLSIRQYSRGILTAARAIEANTATISATHDTIGVGVGLVAGVDAVAIGLDTLASTLETRARG